MRSQIANIDLPIHYQQFLDSHLNIANTAVLGGMFNSFTVGAVDPRDYILGIQDNRNGSGGRTYTAPIIGKLDALVISKGPIGQALGFEYDFAKTFSLRAVYLQDRIIHDKLTTLQFAWTPLWVRVL